MKDVEKFRDINKFVSLLIELTNCRLPTGIESYNKEQEIKRELIKMYEGDL